MAADAPAGRCRWRARRSFAIERAEALAAPKFGRRENAGVRKCLDV
jgi:hypothetical protein